MSYSYCISFLERGNICSSMSFLERTDWISTNSISYNYSTNILLCFLRAKQLHPSHFLFSFWHFASKHRVEPQAWNYKQNTHNTTSKFPNKCLLIRGLGPSRRPDYLWPLLFFKLSTKIWVKFLKSCSIPWLKPLSNWVFTQTFNQMKGDSNPYSNLFRPFSPSQTYKYAMNEAFTQIYA